MYTVLSIQAIVAVAAGVIGYLYGGMPAALAALFGTCIALCNTLLLVWRQYRGKRQLHADPNRHLRSFYSSIFERYVVVGLLFAAGFGGLQLAPLPLMIAFVAGQMAWLFSWIDHGIKT